MPRSLKSKRLPPIHPGEVLPEEFLTPMKLTPYALAKACGVPRTRIERLAREETPVTADTALRLPRYFGSTPESGGAAVSVRFGMRSGHRRRLIGPDQATGEAGGVVENAWAS